MRIRSQIEIHNADQVRLALINGKKRLFKKSEALHEAAVMSGEIISRLNNDHKITAEEIIKHYKPKYLNK